MDPLQISPKWWCFNHSIGGTKYNPTSLGQLKTALEHIEEIASVEITEDLNISLLPEGYLKTEKEFVIAGRVFTLQLAEGQESQLDDVNPNVIMVNLMKQTQ